MECFHNTEPSVNLRFLQVSPGLQGWCLPGCSSHLNMGRVDVASVVLLGWYQLYSGIIIGKHILESISFCIFRQPGCWALPIDQSLFKNSFIFGEDHSLLQALFQNLTLEDRTRDEWQPHVTAEWAFEILFAASRSSIFNVKDSIWNQTKILPVTKIRKDIMLLARCRMQNSVWKWKLA